MSEPEHNLLRREDIDATRRPFVEALSLPGPAYRDPRVFAAEIEALFLKMWVCVGHRSRLASPGDYFTREIGDESIIVTRDTGGSFRAFYNVCRHRGTRLLDEGSGTGLDCIRCPYHGWSYGRGGELIAAPLMEEVGGFDKADYGLTPVRCDTWNGFVFVTFDPDTPALAVCLADAPDLERFGIDRMGLGATHEYTLAANWKLVCENYGECYHCPSNHPQLNRVSHYRGGGNSFEGECFCGGPMRLNDGCATMTMTGQTNRGPIEGLDADDLGLVHYFNVYPAFLLSVHPDYVLTHTIWPLAADRSVIRCEWLFPSETMEHNDYDPSDAVDFWHLTNEQDWAICERAQKGVQSRGYRPGPYHGLEETIYFFDNWYLRAMGTALPGSPDGDSA